MRNRDGSAEFACGPPGFHCRSQLELKASLQFILELDENLDGEVTIKLVENEEELAGAIAVRFRVFVSEQSIPPEEELDQADATSSHAIALVGDTVVGTGRLIRQDPSTGQIGRMAVDREWRRRGVGGQILQYLEDLARSRGMTLTVLHAQEYVKAFYATRGYQQHGEVFLEVDIPHVEMWKDL